MQHQALGISIAAAVILAISPSARGSTLYVAGNGVDGPDCGPKAGPCRSISRAIDNAAAGDKVIVGPGSYGDLNVNGILGEAGEETPAPGCACVLAVNKPVALTSSDGAAATVVDARGVASATNVLIIADGGEFGKPGKGFTVTSTASLNGDGIVIDGTDVKVRGNQVVATGRDPLIDFRGTGIGTVAGSQIVLIEANQVIGWFIGIAPLGAGKTIRKNRVSLNLVGILAKGSSVVVGNVATANFTGIDLSEAAGVVGNAASGNANGFVVDAFSGPFSGILEMNNMVGNGACGLTAISVGVTPGLLAAHNYWGAATGPGPDPAENVCNEKGGTVTVEPFAAKPFKVKAPIKP